MLATNYNLTEKRYAEEVFELCRYIGDKYSRYLTIEESSNCLIVREYTDITCTGTWTGELFYLSNYHDLHTFLLGYYAGLKTR